MKITDKNTFSYRLRTVRKDSKLTQAKLAERQWEASDDKSPYIVTWHGLPIKSIKTAWKTTLKNAGITRRLRPYDLRHQFITAALEGGADLKALSEVVGSRPETLMRNYQHVSRALRRVAVETIPVPLDIQNIAKKPDKN